MEGEIWDDPVHMSMAGYDSLAALVDHTDGSSSAVSGITAFYKLQFHERWQFKSG